MATARKHYFRHSFYCHTKPPFEYLIDAGGTEFYGAYWIISEKAGAANADKKSDENDLETFTTYKRFLCRTLKFSTQKLDKFLEICHEYPEKPIIRTEILDDRAGFVQITVRKLLNFISNESEIGAIKSKGEERRGNKSKGESPPLKKINEDTLHQHTYEFVKITEKEFQKLVADHGIDFANKCLEVLDNYKGASGKKYKSDYRAILNWAVGRVKEEMPKQTNQRVSEKDYFDKLKTRDERLKYKRVVPKDGPAYYERKKDEQ